MKPSPQTLSDLAKVSLPEGVTLTELAPDYPALQVETPTCSATLALHGAHLIHWQPQHTQQSVLYTSPDAIYQEGKAIRGGIPLCWPWFNAHPTAPDKHPSHGIARNRFWQLQQVSLAGNNIEIELTLVPDQAIASHVTFPFELRASFTLGQSLTASLSAKNLSTEPVLIGGALHSYLAVSDISQVSVNGLQNTPYIDTTQTPEPHLTQRQRDLTIDSEIDRIYYGSSNRIHLHDPQWNRCLTVANDSSLTSVIWNPWQEKARQLGDLPDQDYRRFLCIEAANARHDARVILPSQTNQDSGTDRPHHHLSTTITVA